MIIPETPELPGLIRAVNLNVAAGQTLPEILE